MRRTVLAVVFLLTLAIVALAQQQNGGIGPFPPPNNGTTGFTYQASNSTYHFTRTDGSFSGVLIFENSAEPGYPFTHDYSTDAVNIDGQRDLITFHYNNDTQSYQTSSLLDLDEDGHFSLGSSSGGGIGSDSSTGDTCIPVNVSTNGPCNVPTALHITTAGTISQYMGLPLDPGGRGTSVIARAINGSAVGTVNNYPVWTTPASGYGSAEYYELSWVGVVTNPSQGAIAMATWTFIDESGPNSCTSAPSMFGAVGNRMELTCRFFSVANAPISVSVLVNGGSPTYASHLRIIIH